MSASKNPVTTLLVANGTSWMFPKVITQGLYDFVLGFNQSFLLIVGFAK